MDWAGLFMLALVAVLLIATGLPAFMVLIGVSVVFAVLGVALDVFPAALLQALPNRIVGLLESDLLQALPLFVLMGVLLDRLPIVDILFRSGDRALRHTGAAPQISALGLGALLAPMNGSVGASVATLSRVVRPKLMQRRVATADSLAIVCVASTLGVVVPPSLVLILLGDAMMRAHTEALNKTGASARIINTQDVYIGALVPAALFFVLCLAIAWWRARAGAGARQNAGAPAEVRHSEKTAALLTVGFIVLLLAGVAAGYFYAVEAAAMGAFALFTFGVLSGALSRATVSSLLYDAMAVAGALFALLAAATSFTLVFRAFGSDKLLDIALGNLPLGATGTTIVVLLVLAACAFVLDAFEIIFVVIPILMPPLLAREPDAVWVAVATLLVLQASFLIPPVGYAVMMARAAMRERIAVGPLARALAPFLAAQAAVLALVLVFPGLTHIAGGDKALPSSTLSDEDVHKAIEDSAPPPPQPAKLPGTG